ncbi:MAG: hypothetical protein K0R84_1093 [Clostridia bacterium]|nr:hypothetical protein [Clostridia bacterium]
MATLKKFIDNFEEYVGTVFMILMGLGVTLGVISRLLEIPMNWTSEVARYSFIWAVFLGAVVATKQKGHIIIEVFINLFSEKIRKALYVLSNTISLIFLAVLAYYGFILMFEFWDTKMSLLPFSMGYVYASLPTCSTLMVIRILQNLYSEFLNKKEEA